jgi:branched-subunit amino acid transport protein AzlD
MNYIFEYSKIFFTYFNIAFSTALCYLFISVDLQLPSRTVTDVTVATAVNAKQFWQTNAMQSLQQFFRFNFFASCKRVFL